MILNAIVIIIPFYKCKMSYNIMLTAVVIVG